MLILLLIVAGGGVVGYVYAQNNQEPIQSEPPEEELDGQNSETENDRDSQPEEPEVTDIQISAVGDIMVHDTQLESAYDSETDSYNFESVFEDIKPFIEESDLSIANLETTLAGDSLPYTGYPIFNAPDTIIDALDFAGFDTLITANNHSLDTQADGLRRTAQVVREEGLDAVGTYENEPDSRILMKDVEGIRVAILAYTEMVNFLDVQYSPEELRPMINMMSEEQIIQDVEEAREQEADVILTYMHWGTEYQEEVNDTQSSYAELLTREGVDIIIGSHPHVIQSTSMVEAGGNQSFVAYSLGNFISNQRVESLGQGYEPSEDGVVLNINIQKDERTQETTISNIEIVPTWVYRSPEEEGETHTYRILPIEETLEENEYPDEFLDRMRQSLEETNRRMNIEAIQMN